MLKNLLLFIFVVLSVVHLQAQIDPVDSPFYNDGDYTIVADSNLTDVSKPLLFYYPETAGSYPIFIFQLGANGFGSSAINRHTYDLYLKHLASYGFVVIVIDDSQAGFPNGASMTATHDWVKTKIDDPTHWLSTYGAQSPIILGGHSNGGVNACALLVERPTEIDGIVFMDSYPSTGVVGFGAHDVSGYTGKEMSMAAGENDPDPNKEGYESFTSASCKTYVRIEGLDHGGFGDYVNPDQPVGSIGRTNATASVRHFLVSWMLSEFGNSYDGSLNLSDVTLHPNTVEEFENDCMSSLSASLENEVKEEVVIYPNPVNTILSIDTQESFNKINIYNTLGRLVISKEVNESVESINVEALNAGTYILELSNNTKQIIRKRFVKQ